MHFESAPNAQAHGKAISAGPGAKKHKSLASAGRRERRKFGAFKIETEKIPETWSEISFVSLAKEFPLL